MNNLIQAICRKKLAALGLAILLFVTLQYLILVFVGRAILDDVESRMHVNTASALAQSIQARANRTNIDHGIREVLSYAKSLNPDLGYSIVDSGGKILSGFGPGPLRRGHISTDQLERELRRSANRPLAARIPDPFSTTEQSLFSVAPLELSANRGYVLVTLSSDSSSLLQSTSGMIALAAQLIPAFLFTLLLVSSVLALFLFYVSRNFRNLLAAAREIENGNYHARVDVQGEDEIGVLATEFNRMTDALVEQEAKAKKVEERRKSLIASIVHDVRAPLAAMKGYVDLLLERRRGMADEEVLRLLNVISRNAKRQELFLKDLTDLTEVELNERPHSRAHFRINEAAKNVIELYLPRAQARNISIDSKVDTPIGMYGDKEQIERALDNLLRNALQHTPDGGSIIIELGNRDGAICFSIEDSGGGIPPEAIPKLFDEFFRLPASGEGPSDRSGLGLAIVKRIVEVHGGSVAVSSTVNIGSKFSLSFPEQIAPAGSTLLPTPFPLRVNSTSSHGPLRYVRGVWLGGGLIVALILAAYLFTRLTFFLGSIWFLGALGSLFLASRQFNQPHRPKYYLPWIALGVIFSAPAISLAGPVQHFAARALSVGLPIALVMAIRSFGAAFTKKALCLIAPLFLAVAYALHVSPRYEAYLFGSIFGIAVGLLVNFAFLPISSRASHIRLSRFIPIPAFLGCMIVVYQGIYFAVGILVERDSLSHSRASIPAVSLQLDRLQQKTRAAENIMLFSALFPKFDSWLLGTKGHVLDSLYPQFTNRYDLPFVPGGACRSRIPSPVLRLGGTDTGHTCVQVTAAMLPSLGSMSAFVSREALEYSVVQRKSVELWLWIVLLVQCLVHWLLALILRIYSYYQLTKPIQTLLSVIDRAASGDSTIRADAKTEQLLPTLTRGLNRLLQVLGARLESVNSADRHRRALLGDLTIELGAPIHQLGTLAQHALDMAKHGVPESLTDALLQLRNRMDLQLELLDDLLTLMKLDIGEAALFFASASFFELVDPVIISVRETLARRGISISLDIVEDDAIVADAALIMQAISSVIRVLTDGASSGSTLTVVGNADVSSFYCSFSFPFDGGAHQLSSAARRLLLARRILTAHGGEIREISDGRKTEILFLLPRARAESSKY